MGGTLGTIRHIDESLGRAPLNAYLVIRASDCSETSTVRDGPLTIIRNDYRRFVSPFEQQMQVKTIICIMLFLH